MGAPYNIEVVLLGESAAPSNPSPETEKKKPEPPLKKPLPPAKETIHEKTPEVSPEPEYESMADMDYLPEETYEVVAPQEIQETPVITSIAPLEPLKKLEQPPATEPLKAVEPAQVEPTITPRKKLKPEDTLPVESLQEVADLFKGKIVERRNV